MTKKVKIGIFDSGVGGLSVAAWVRRENPGADYFYCCDNLNFPYGTKTDAEVIECTVRNCQLFAQACSLDVLVIACNTASTVALEHIRQALPCAVVGVVPAIKPAAELSKTKSLALLATPATVQRPYTKKLIADFAGGCQVHLHGSSALVHLAEKKLRSEHFSLDEIKSELDALFERAGGEDIDVVVLGCTHFPLLRDEFSQLRPGVVWVESGPAIAARVKSLIGSVPVKSGSAGGIPGDTAFFTAETEAVPALRSAMLTYSFNNLSILQ